MPLPGCMQRCLGERGKPRAGLSHLLQGKKRWEQWDFPRPLIHLPSLAAPLLGDSLIGGLRLSLTPDAPMGPRRGDRGHESPVDLTRHVLPKTSPCSTLLPDWATLYPSLPAPGLAGGPPVCWDRYFSSGEQTLSEYLLCAGPLLGPGSEGESREESCALSQ